MPARLPDVDQLLRDERFDELQRLGLLERGRAPREPGVARRALTWLRARLTSAKRSVPGTLTIREARPEDERVIARLAELEEREAPSGTILVAEVEQEILAVLPFDGTAPIADPLRPMEGLVDLLRLRKRQLEQAEKTAA